MEDNKQLQLTDAQKETAIRNEMEALKQKVELSIPIPSADEVDLMERTSEYTLKQIKSKYNNAIVVTLDHYMKDKTAFTRGERQAVLAGVGKYINEQDKIAISRRSIELAEKIAEQQKNDHLMDMLSRGVSGTIDLTLDGEDKTDGT